MRLIRHKLKKQQLASPKRRLSIWRLLLGMIILGSLVYGGIFGTHQWKDARSTVSRKPWFAAYADVTATPAFAFEQLGETNTREVILSFIVSLPAEPCQPSWGAAYDLDQASATLDLDRRIARLRQQDGTIAVSFGGLRNDELAVQCADADKLKAAYQGVVERYNIDTIDLDLEGHGLTDVAAGQRRAVAIATLQKERRAAGKKLAVWVTLPVAPQGLTKDGTDAVAQLLAEDVDLAGVNAMTMDYGQSRVKGQSMLQASISALRQTHRQLSILYQRAGIQLSANTVWAKIGATPMIGQNDVVNEVFTLEDAKGLNQFAKSQGIARMSMWSANRDLKCGSNYVDIKIVSTSCSGVKQDKYGFATALSLGFGGSLSLSSGAVTKEDAAPAKQKPDDPKTSPYQIWKESGAYLQGTKVVWHHNVYQSKWWTQGDVPDNPVLQSWETPWELVGPVLPGEKLIPQATLPEGTYPSWTGKTDYEEGDRVLFNGVPYQAKWWNEGESPAEASSNPDGSPWAPLTQAQINDILAKHESEDSAN